MKKPAFILLCLIITLNLSGCWSNQELAQRAIITGVGLDKAADNKMELTLQLVSPSSFSDEYSTSESKSTSYTISTTGITVFDAVRQQLSSIGRKPFYSHVQIIVIGEELAKEGLNDILDFFQRDAEPRLTTRILIAKGTTAKEILNAKSKLEMIPAVHLRSIMEYNHDSNPAIRDIMLIDLLELSAAVGKAPVIAGIDIVNKTKDLYISDMRINHSGAFKNGKLVGWLNTEETIGLSYVENKAKNVIIQIPNPSSPDKYIAIEQLSSTARNDIKYENNAFKGTIHVNAIGAVGEIQGNAEFSKPDFIEKLNIATEAKIKEQIQSTIEIAQENFQSDILGFGELAKRKHNKAWKESQADWDEIFGEMPIEVNVRFEIRRTGNISTPTKFD